jgi:hypothetical protein
MTEKCGDIPPINSIKWKGYLDPEVVPMVKFLRDMGLITFYSCGGHKNVHDGADRTSFGKFYVDFYGTDTMSIEDFTSYLAEKTGGKTSLKVRLHKGMTRATYLTLTLHESARFSGKIKDFHKIFPSEQSTQIIPPFNEYIYPEVCPMVKFIREMGYKTYSSCGGHKETYGRGHARMPYGYFIVQFIGTDTIHVDEFKNYLFEKTGGKTSLKFEYAKNPGMSKEMWEAFRKAGDPMIVNKGTFAGKIKDFHKIFPAEQENTLLLIANPK